MKHIGVIGAGECGEDLAAIAEELGKKIAIQGAVLICGGLGGVMEAAAKGARSEGGRTIGILPSVNKKDANPYIDTPVCTGMGHARNVIIVLTSDVLIAVGGEYGTLSEIALALKAGKPVISIESGWDIRGVSIAKNVDEAINMAFNLCK